MPAKQKAEKRADPNETTGKKYTLKAFEDLYGAKLAKKFWKKAGDLEKKGASKKDDKKGDKKADKKGDKKADKKGEKKGEKKGAKKEKQEERRRDPTDAKSTKTYTRKQFDDFYGDAGKTMWKKAAAVTPKPEKTADDKKKKEAPKPAAPKVDKDLLAEATKAALSKPAKSVILVAPFSSGLPEAKHFKIEESEVTEDLEDKQVLAEILYMSADPYLRARIKMMKEGETMAGFVSGRILASKNKKWKPGDVFGANLPFATVQKFNPSAPESSIWRLTGIVKEEKLSHGIGVMGMPGSTAYGGVHHILRPKKPRKKKGEEVKGEVLFVSAASGAVGQLVGQIAKKTFKCTVIGSAGGPEKCALLKEKFGFDHAIDYKSVKDADELAAKLKEATGSESAACIDMYFENVGGMHFDAALKSLKPGGRIAVCGCISGYNETKPPTNDLPLWSLIYPQIRIEGFVCSRWLSGKEGAFLETMGKTYKGGGFQIEETITEGIDEWPTAFNSLFTGANKGKVVVKVADALPLRKPKEPKAPKEPKEPKAAKETVKE